MVLAFLETIMNTAKLSWLEFIAWVDPDMPYLRLFRGVLGDTQAQQEIDRLMGQAAGSWFTPPTCFAPSSPLTKR